MATVKYFTFNPFQENTYVVYDDSNDCIIIDPGCSNSREEKELRDFIAEKNLRPVRLLNTHCHIDHVLGNAFVAESYGLPLEINILDLPLLQAVENQAKMFGLNAVTSPEPEHFLKEGDKITFGKSSLDVLFVPGHAPGHLAFVNREEKWVISGDVLFQRSIGRTDLPGGDFDVLIKSIRDKILTLGEDYVVFSGHGPRTTVGEEIKYNPFLN